MARERLSYCHEAGNLLLAPGITRVDAYEAYAEMPQINPHGAASGTYHLARGGGWNRGGHMCKVYDRGNYRPEYASNAVGLRLVLSA